MYNTIHSIIKRTRPKPAFKYYFASWITLNRSKPKFRINQYCGFSSSACLTACRWEQIYFFCSLGNSPDDGRRAWGRSGHRKHTGHVQEERRQAGHGQHVRAEGAVGGQRRPTTHQQVQVVQEGEQHVGPDQQSTVQQQGRQVQGLQNNGRLKL